MRLLRLCFALLCLLALARPLPALAQGEGTIAGSATLASGRALPDGLEAELLFLPNSQGPPQITAQPLGPDGVFRFEGVDAAPQHRYLVRVTMDGADNYTDILAFGLDQRLLDDVSLAIVERTRDASTLALREVSYILDPRSAGWLVVGLFTYENSGAQTIVNEDEPPVEIPLPEAAFQIQLGPDVPTEGARESADGFSYSGPFAPGTTPLIFTYLLPYQEGAQSLTFSTGTAVPSLRVLVADAGQQSASDDLAAQGEQPGPDGRPFALFTAQNVSAAQQFTLDFAALPPLPTPMPQSGAPDGAAGGTRTLPISPLERLPWWSPLLPIAAALGGLALYVVRRPATSSAEQRARLRERRDTLVAEIAALDIRFESGAIGEQTHSRQRAALKRELRDVLRQSGEGVPAALVDS